MPGDPSLLTEAGWAESRGGTRNNLFYSFDVGAVHVAILSTEHDLSPGSIQLAWLEADLRALDRAQRPFVLLGLHRPVYTSTKGGSALPETAGMQAALEPLLLRHRVTIVVAGHYHQYERSCRVAAGECMPPPSNGTVHITAGIGGVQHHEEWLSPQPAWVETQSVDRYGFMLLEVVNRTHAKVQVVDSTDHDAVFDEFWVTA